MNSTEVELLVRGVILHLGLPFSVLSVVGAPAGWNIMVRTDTDTGRIVRFTLPSGQPTAIRTTIQETLEAQF